MKTMLIVLLTVLPSTALAQPAKDLFDAQQAARQHERDLLPALQLARETAGVLRLYLGVEGTLGSTQLPAGSALDKAIIQIDDYGRELEKRRAILPTDIRKSVGTARDMLDRARIPMPADLTLLRDKWHHQIVHPTARRVSQDAQQINALISSYTGIENALRQIQTTQLGVLANAENVPGLPQGAPQP